VVYIHEGARSFGTVRWVLTDHAGLRQRPVHGSSGNAAGIAKRRGVPPRPLVEEAARRGLAGAPGAPAACMRS